MTEKTVVFQTAAPNPALLVQECMGSVKDWAHANSYDYHFINDEFFDVLPRSTQGLSSRLFLARTDYARLLWAEKLLTEYDCFIWMDADILVLTPEHQMCVDKVRASFARELWIRKEKSALTAYPAINNSVLMFRKESILLQLYLEQLDWMLRAGEGKLKRCSMGTDFLTALGRAVHLPLVPGTCTISPAMYDPTTRREALAIHARYSSCDMIFANLCSSTLNERGILADAQSDFFIQLMLEHNAQIQQESNLASKIMFVEKPYGFWTSWLNLGKAV